ncbi:MAG TPA: Hsp20/alpha crystallin family protein [Gammaproteobacteria bacterium]|nr:Hsp20/alpha crystallin family protein [Gammaproteobacteria bacterium]
MNTIRYEPWSLMTQLHNEMNRLFERTDRDGAVAATDWVPAVDIREEDARFVIHADVPGVDPKDIEVTMEDGVLTLRGERKSETRDEENGWRRVERVTGTFYRRFSLPDTADAEGVTARGSNGVLEIVIPKQAKVQPRRITVKAA